MGGDSIISIEKVSKYYSINSTKPVSLRESFVTFIRPKEHSEQFKALDNVDIKIQKGEIVGIIGRNGAGKSTLLKVLSKITKPSEGRIEIIGRVASLLEVGTGFHPELTGRENIFLNGTILGMSRKEIKDKLDEIIEFSGVGKFIETPVKHYSSGMYVRLAFAVAAHLEPEILIIDEVLAVGDASFQKKCLGKMEDIANKGRTVIFVSHDMGAVSSLCNRGVYLKKGRVAFEGGIKETLDKYLLDSSKENKSNRFYNEKSHFAENDGTISLLEMGLVDCKLAPISSFYINEKVGVRVRYKLEKTFEKQPVPNFHINHSLGGKLFVSIANIDVALKAETGVKDLIMWVPANFFNSGHFKVGIAISSLNNSKVHIADYDGVSFEVLDDLNSEVRNGYKGKIDGYLLPKMLWEEKFEEQ